MDDLTPAENTPYAALQRPDPRPLDQNPAAVYLAGLGSARSRQVQRQALDALANLLSGRPDCLALDWPALRFQHTAALRALLLDDYAPATANRLLSALRGVLKAAWQLGQMTSEDYQRARAVASVPGQTLPAGRELTMGEIAALLGACENDRGPAGVRDAALIAAMYPGGLRREEVTGLDLDDYDPFSGALTVRHGKRNKARLTYLSDGAGRALADWLALRGSQPGPLFCPVNKGRRLIHAQRLTAQAVYNALARRGAQANVRGFSPHDLRRTFVSHLLDAGADIATVARLAGHASVTTTARYDRRPEAAKAKAAGLLHLPYRGRLVR